MSEKAQNPPHVSLLTPQSPSGIAVISLSGPGSNAVLAHLFERRGRSRRKLPAPSTAAHGFLHQDGRLLDEVLLVNTGGEHERFEICCHGGSAAASAIMNALIDAGAMALPWSRLVEADTLDHDILVALLQCKGPSQAAVLAHLQNGCLKDALQEVLQAVTGALHALAPGEGVDDPSGRQKALHLLEKLEKSHDLGRFLENPPKVVILGAPNAGKSTLFNAILGEHRVLTSKIPGTTRDPVEALFLLEGFPVRLYDLPGIEAHRASAIQEQTMAEAERLIQEADLILGVVDANVVTIDGPGELPGFETSSPCIAETQKRAINILNKTDLLDNEDLTLRHAGNLEKESNIVCLSALKDHGLERLFDTMSRILGLDILKRRFQPQLFNNEQVTMIVELRTVFEQHTWNPHIFQRLSSYLTGSVDRII